MTGSAQMMPAMLPTITCAPAHFARPEPDEVVAIRPRLSITSLLVGASVGSLAGRLVATQALVQLRVWTTMKGAER